MKDQEKLRNQEKVRMKETWQLDAPDLDLDQSEKNIVINYRHLGDSWRHWSLDYLLENKTVSMINFLYLINLVVFKRILLFLGNTQ